MTDKSKLLEFRKAGGLGRYRRFKMVIGGEVLLDLNEVSSVELGASSMIINLKESWGTLYVVEREAYPSVMEYMANRAKQELDCETNTDDLPFR